MKNTILVLAGISYANPADIDNNGAVGPSDLAIFVAAWGSDDSPTANWNPDCDIASPADGVVDGKDWGVLSANWLWTALDDMVWVYINDSGAGMKDEDGLPISHGGFTGEMSKYETTNAQYCAFLNAALASGDITVGTDDIVCGASGTNGGEDFVGQTYFVTYAASSYSQITYSGGIFSVRSRDGYDMSNHPVVMVSWYGATAFCNYYGFRLPTEWEWQAVADHTVADPYIYGCGTTIDQSKANYDIYNPLGFSSWPYTNPVDYYPSYGYGINDIAGNVWEWTSSLWDPAYSYRIFRGGAWSEYDNYCTVSYGNGYLPFYGYDYIGFRVCR